MFEKIIQIEKSLSLLKIVKQRQNDYDRKSNKCLNAHTSTHSLKQIQKLNIDMNYAAMELHKSKIAFNKSIYNSCLDVGINEEIYSPDGWHEFRK